jgi:hypothetical protein
VARPYILRSSGGGLAFIWGAAADVPVPDDYNGDGKTDVAVYRPCSGHWFEMNQITLQWGATGDIPMPRRP